MDLTQPVRTRLYELRMSDTPPPIESQPDLLNFLADNLEDLFKDPRFSAPSDVDMATVFHVLVGHAITYGVQHDVAPEMIDHLIAHAIESHRTPPDPKVIGYDNWLMQTRAEWVLFYQSGHADAPKFPTLKSWMQLIIDNGSSPDDKQFAMRYVNTCTD